MLLKKSASQRYLSVENFVFKKPIDFHTIFWTAANRIKAAPIYKQEFGGRRFGVCVGKCSLTLAFSSTQPHLAAFPDKIV